MVCGVVVGCWLGYPSDLESGVWPKDEARIGDATDAVLNRKEPRVTTHVGALSLHRSPDSSFKSVSHAHGNTLSFSPKHHTLQLSLHSSHHHLTTISPPMLRFRHTPGSRPSSPFRLRRSSSEASPTTSDRPPSTPSPADSLASSAANSTSYTLPSTTLPPPDPLAPIIPLSTLIHPLTHLATSPFSRVYALPRRTPRLLKAC